MRIAIRSDSGTQVGGGHVMRCLSIALAAREAGHEVRFVCAEVEGHLGDRDSTTFRNPICLMGSKRSL